MGLQVGVFGCVSEDMSETWLETRKIHWKKYRDGSVEPLFQENDGSFHQNIDTPTRRFLTTIEKDQWDQEPLMQSLWIKCLLLYGLEEIIEPE